MKSQKNSYYWKDEQNTITKDELLSRPASLNVADFQPADELLQVGNLE